MRGLRLACLILVPAALGAVLQSVWIAFMVGTLVSPPDTKPAKGEREPIPFVSIQGTPLPPVPPNVVRAEIAIFQRVVRVLRTFGETSVLGRGCAFLAMLHAAVGEYVEAEQLFAEARKILSKSGAPPMHVAWVHNNHGLMQLQRGRYAEGVQSFHAASMMSGPKSVQLGRVVALQNLGGANAALGDPDDAERFFLEALELQESLAGANSMPHQVVRSNLATLYLQIGDLDSARALLEKLASERLDRLTRFTVFSNLAYTLSLQDRFAEAERWFEKTESIAPLRSLAGATVLTNRMVMYGRAGRLEQAAATGEAARRLVEKLDGKDSITAGAILTELGLIAFRRGQLGEAERLLVRAVAIFRVRHSDEARIVAERALALVAQRLGQHERAAALSRHSLQLAKAHLNDILAFASEAQRLAYQRQAAPYDQLATFGEPNLIAEAVLSMKGAVLESLLAERALGRGSSREAERRLDRIDELKLQIQEKIGAGNRDIQSLEQDLKKEQTAVARQFASRLHGSDVRAVTVRRVQAQLAEDQVLVEIVRFRRFEGRIAKEAYGAAVIPRSGAPAWVPLGDAAVIDDAIDRAVTGFRTTERRTLEPVHSADVVAAARELHERVWKPITAAFPSRTRRVVISPDGATCFLPWAALLDENDRFVAERWQLTQIGSGRDLLRPASAAPAKTWLALGDGAGNLQYSEQEVVSIGAAARRYGWRTTILLRERAKERELALHPRPGVLHVATHGGRLPAGLTDAVQTRLSRNPMYRGYLILDGGSDALRLWTKGHAIPFATDGILTAEEASTLDLRDTWLTVLSACQTGAGDVREGEGVMGLRRGFTLAGTQNLVFALWSVDDRATAEFMQAFYDRLLPSADLARSFQETQVAELQRWKKSDGLAAAIDRAGAFVLTR